MQRLSSWEMSMRVKHTTGGKLCSHFLLWKVHLRAYSSYLHTVTSPYPEFPIVGLRGELEEKNKALRQTTVRIGSFPPQTNYERIPNLPAPSDPSQAQANNPNSITHPTANPALPSVQIIPLKHVIFTELPQTFNQRCAGAASECGTP